MRDWREGRIHPVVSEMLTKMRKPSANCFQSTLRLVQPVR